MLVKQKQCFNNDIWLIFFNLICKPGIFGPLDDDDDDGVCVCVCIFFLNVFMHKFLKPSISVRQF